jgi:hypothetical protein
MAEYIDKQAAIDNIEKSFDKETILNRFVRKIAISAVRRMESADVCPIIRGNWIYSDEAYPGQNPYGHYECDVCYDSVPYPTRYCPKCGAYMKGKNDD